MKFIETIINIFVQKLQSSNAILIELKQSLVSSEAIMTLPLRKGIRKREQQQQQLQQQIKRCACAIEKWNAPLALRFWPFSNSTLGRRDVGFGYLLFAVTYLAFFFCFFFFVFLSVGRVQWMANWLSRWKICTCIKK